jgi:hypothetical protein
VAEHHDLAPFEQARFELVNDPFSRAPVATVRRIGIFRRFIGIAEDGRVMAQSRILFGFDRLGNFQNIDAQQHKDKSQCGQREVRAWIVADT